MNCFSCRKCVFEIAALTAIATAMVMVGCTQKTEINAEAALKSVQKTGKLCLLKVFKEIIVTKEVDRIKGTYVAPCDAILALDFTEIGISNSNGTYVVSMPPISVEQARVDRDGFTTFDVSKIKNPLGSSDKVRQAAMQEAEERIRQEALADRCKEMAVRQATNIVTSLIRQVEKRDGVSIVWVWKLSE